MGSLKPVPKSCIVKRAQLPAFFKDLEKFHFQELEPRRKGIPPSDVLMRKFVFCDQESPDSWPFIMVKLDFPDAPRVDSLLRKCSVKSVPAFDFLADHTPLRLTVFCHIPQLPVESAILSRMLRGKSNFLLPCGGLRVDLRADFTVAELLRARENLTENWFYANQVIQTSGNLRAILEQNRDAITRFDEFKRKALMAICIRFGIRTASLAESFLYPDQMNLGVVRRRVEYAFRPLIQLVEQNFQHLTLGHIALNQTTLNGIADKGM